MGTIKKGPYGAQGGITITKSTIIATSMRESQQNE